MHLLLALAATLVWGFPLGVTEDELKAAVGAPTRTNTFKNQLTNTQGISWVYERNGVSYFVTFRDGRTSTIEAQGRMETPLVADPGSPLADPLGLRLGDSAGKMLVDTGAVTGLNPKTNMTITTASISVTRDNLRYMYQIFSGRISSEWITLVSQ